MKRVRFSPLRLLGVSIATMAIAITVFAPPVFNAPAQAVVVLLFLVGLLLSVGVD